VLCVVVLLYYIIKKILLIILKYGKRLKRQNKTTQKLSHQIAEQEAEIQTLSGIILSIQNLLQ
jgi:hypothetical protein